MPVKSTDLSKHIHQTLNQSDNFVYKRKITCKKQLFFEKKLPPKVSTTKSPGIKKKVVSKLQKEKKVKVYEDSEWYNLGM